MERSGNLFDGSFKGLKDGEVFCGVWYEKRTLGRDDNLQGILSYVSYNDSNVYCLDEQSQEEDDNDAESTA